MSDQESQEMSEEVESVDDSDRDPNYVADSEISAESASSESEDNLNDSDISENEICQTKINDNKMQTSESTNFINCTSKHSGNSSLQLDGDKFCQFDEYKMKANGELRKGKKSKDFCFFCESLVLNFARHIQRNHSLEIEVQKISTLPANSKERRQLLTLLRNKGNFLVSTTKPKPIRQPDLHGKVIPCPNCLGFYSAKQLWKHKRRCVASEKGGSHQKDAQRFLTKHLRVDPELVEKVFPRMRADEISLVAKKDALICAFGARYMKIHREKHFVNVTSRNMRELARLLLEVKKEEPSISNLFEALKPKYFDLLVSSSKRAANYDAVKDVYGAPSFALRLKTSLKQCCELAIVFALKRKEVYSTIPAAEAEADLKTLIQLIDSQWRFEISNKASSDLDSNKWNKVTLVPLAKDLKLFRDHLIFKSEDAARRLTSDASDIDAYVTLLETVYCRLLSLNRRRPGELQRVPLCLYEETKSSSQNYEEFAEVVTPSEKILLKRFKRIFVRGKRGRGVPILFSDDIQKHIKLLLAHRSNFINRNNPYLFGNLQTIQPICGYKVLKKYAVSCGAKNPTAITATRLRKHLATLTQLFNMSETDIEQLAAFMGHTVGVHKGSYRLPDDVYQTAKISKLLILMEKGEAGQFKGKSLDEIEIDLDEDLLQNIEKEQGADDDELGGELYDIIAENPDVIENKRCRQTETSTTRKKRVLVPWTVAQKKVVNKFFAKHIEKKVPPKKNECEALKEQHPELLKNKDWLKIKVYVQNQYTKK